ncbi:MAG: alpha/beta hydrolase [Leptospiraceae bacterium]|nr:alpha/beta hydrolase [Leptospiraceae bacterium]
MIAITEFLSFLLSVVSGIFYSKEKVLSRLDNNDILILPGLGSGAWFYNKMAKYLKSKGYRPFVVPLPPWRSEKNIILSLNAYLLKAKPNTIVIAHNTSALLIPALPDGTRRKIDTLVTLGAPFKGFRLWGIFSFKNWEPNSSKLAIQHPAYLFINRFFPLAPIHDYLFQPKDSLAYGQGRDQWFDIPGNYNLVRKAENLRTLSEFLFSVNPPIPPIPKDTTVLTKDIIISQGTRNQDSRLVSNPSSKKSSGNQTKTKPISKAKKPVKQTKTKLKAKPKSKRR